jgi:hypothetical protein
MINADDVFNPKDFESIRLHVYFKNSTTGTEIRDPKKVTLTEIGDKYLVFDMPSKSCNAKHNVAVDIHQFDQRTKKETEILKVTGKVFSMEDADDGRCRVTVECVQFDEESWIRLMKIYSSRQSEIENFFKAVKGY